MTCAGAVRVIWASCAGAPFARIVFESYLSAGGKAPDHVILVPPDTRTSSRLYSAALAASGTRLPDIILLADPAVRAGLFPAADPRRDYRMLPDVFLSQVQSINSAEAHAILRSVPGPTIMLGSSFPEMLRAETLAGLPLGALNLHLGRLPDYRGHFATYWEIRDRLTSGGVTVHWMAARVDTGPSVAVAHIPLAGRSLLRVTIEKKRLGGILLAQALDEVIKSARTPGITGSTSVPPARTWPTLHDILSRRLIG
jgi:methionyl-tRNA formyltransferase